MSLQHKDIEKVFFKGYEDKERKEFLTNLEEALVEGGWFDFDEVCIGVLQYLHDMKDSENKIDINLNEIISRFAIDDEAAKSIINTLENDGLIKAKLFGGKKYVITQKGIAMVNVG
jgi:predicted transcriptional regulator